MPIKITADSFVFGLFIGSAALLASYLGLRYLRLALVDYYGDPYIFASPRVELITMLINIILFRFMILKFRKENTGKGILFITVMIAVAYFILFYRFSYRLP